MTTQLSTTQKSALAALRTKGHLFARCAAWQGGTQRTYNRRTLQALVDAGEAEWTQITLDGRPLDAIATTDSTSTDAQEGNA